MHVAALLVDSRHAGLYGGTGKKANWELACRIKNKKPLILSGGLNERNIAEALQTSSSGGAGYQQRRGVNPGQKRSRETGPNI